MKTPFAVATPRQAQDLTHFFNDQPGLVIQPGRYWEKGWIANNMSLTEDGMVAMKLRQILGPDRELTKAQAHALMCGQVTPARHARKLMEMKLLDSGDALTDDGYAVVHLLTLYNVQTR